LSFGEVGAPAFPVFLAGEVGGEAVVFGGHGGIVAGILNSEFRIQNGWKRESFGVGRWAFGVRRWRLNGERRTLNVGRFLR
jgi:hypothetical protein